MSNRSLIPAALIALSIAASACPAAAQDTSEQRYKAVGKQAGAPTLVERYGPDDLRSGQLRIPKGKGPFPVAVIVHGGCWTASYDTMAGIAGWQTR